MKALLLRSFIPSLGMLLLAASQGDAQGLLIDKSEIRFVSKQLGGNVEGRFRKWKANIVFLPKNLAKSKAEFDIDLGSIDLASDESETEIKSPQWFHTAKFPVAHFASTSIKNVGGDAAFVRPMYQGKLAADIVPQGPGPHFITFQIGAFRADRAAKGERD